VTIKVVLDANFLMIPHQEGVDVFSELDRLLGSYRPIVPRQVLEELKRVKRAATGRDKIAARVALSLVDAKGIEVVDVEGRDGDEAILNLARRWDRVYVATRDKELKKRLWKLGVPVITLRQRTHLVIERG
jgi:rRNA-processing protein FCF1